MKSTEEKIPQVVEDEKPISEDNKKDPKKDLDNKTSSEAQKNEKQPESSKDFTHKQFLQQDRLNKLLDSNQKFKDRKIRKMMKGKEL